MNQYDVHRLEALIRDLTARVARLEADRSTLLAGDRDALEKILPVIAGAVGSAFTTVGELVAHDSVGLKLVLAGWSKHALGNLFRRAEGAIVDGLIVERAGRHHGARQISVRRIVS